MDITFKILGFLDANFEVINIYPPTVLKQLQEYRKKRYEEISKALNPYL